MITIIYLSTVGSVCAFLGVYFLWKRLQLYFSGRQSVGSFVRWETSGLRNQFFHPVVKFSAHDGREYEFVGMPGSSRKREREKYHVLYPENNPQAAMVHGLLAYWTLPLIFFSFAICAGIVAFREW